MKESISIEKREMANGYYIVLKKSDKEEKGFPIGSNGLHLLRRYIVNLQNKAYDKGFHNGYSLAIEDALLSKGKDL